MRSHQARPKRMAKPKRPVRRPAGGATFSQSEATKPNESDIKSPILKELHELRRMVSTLSARVQEAHRTPATSSSRKGGRESCRGGRGGYRGSRGGYMGRGAFKRGRGNLVGRGRHHTNDFYGRCARGGRGGREKFNRAVTNIYNYY